MTFLDKVIQDDGSQPQLLYEFAPTNWWSGRVSKCTLGVVRISTICKLSTKRLVLVAKCSLILIKPALERVHIFFLKKKACLRSWHNSNSQCQVQWLWTTRVVDRWHTSLPRSGRGGKFLSFKGHKVHYETSRAQAPPCDGWAFKKLM